MKIEKSFRQFLKISQIAALIFACCSTIVQASGELDPAFNAALIRSTGFERAAMSVVQPDGKVITYGIFDSAGGVPVSTNVIRLNADGTLDPTFHAESIPGVASVGEMALQSTGKIIIVGAFERGIIRLNTDGTRDSSFVLSPAFPNITTIFDVVVLPDDRLYIGGGPIFARLLPDGDFDQTFPVRNNLTVQKLAVQPSGQIITNEGDSIKRYESNGNADGTFPATSFNSTVWDIAVQADGKILIGGQFTTLNGSPSSKIARLNADGTRDVTFAASPFGNGGLVLRVLPLPDGKILLGGKQTSINNQPVRLNSDGTLDQTYASTLQMSVYDLDGTPDGKVIVSGESAITNSTVKPMYRVNPDGTADLTFQANFGSAGTGRKIFVQPDGKILVGGIFNLANNFLRPSIARFNADGSVDTSFNLAFFYNPNDVVTAIDMQPDGKIIIGANSSTFDARRLNPDGSPDLGFTLTRFTNDLKVLSNGKILIGGANYLKLFNSDGNLDSSFSVTLDGAVQKFAVQPDGKIVIAGTFTTVNSVGRGRIARLNADGTLDNTFDTSTGANAAILDLALQPDGKILIGGLFTGFNLANTPFLARLTASGALETGFLPNLNDSVWTIKIQPDNKILIGGSFTLVNSFSRPHVARLNADGNPDLTFHAGGGPEQTGQIYDIELQSDGKILVGGAFSVFSEARKFGIVRLQNSFAPPETLFDYDGDGKADVSVYRPSTNRWYIYKSSNSTVSETTFGIAGDVPAPADFDGDGKTDIAIFRPSSGDWWSLSSINGAQIFAHWGANGDIPRPSDFDGDGRADYVVFRPSDNFWYRISSGNGASSNGAFGLAGDKPVTGDFDGDGKSDKAIYRPSAGTWWYQSSINGAQLAVQWGISTDVPAPADFDGDGKTDFAVYRPSTGVWYIINSGNGSFLITAFGIAEDKPVPADYDGDGKADIAVFRPSTGTWYQMKTTAGFAAQQFGISTDIPTENAFVP